MSTYSFILKSFGLPLVKPLLFSDIAPTEQDDSIATSQLGTPVWDYIQLSDKRENPTITLRIDTALIDATLPKIINETVVQGRKGRVKEYITEDDWRLVIRGVICSGKKNVYPVEDVTKLKKLAQISSEIPVTSNYLQMLDIFDVVVEELKLTQRSGHRDTQLFELHCKSDTPIELILNEEAE